MLLPAQRVLRDYAGCAHVVRFPKVCDGHVCEERLADGDGDDDGDVALWWQEVRDDLAWLRPLTLIASIVWIDVPQHLKFVRCRKEGELLFQTLSMPLLHVLLRHAHELSPSLHYHQRFLRCLASDQLYLTTILRWTMEEPLLRCFLQCALQSEPWRPHEMLRRSRRRRRPSWLRV